MSETTETIKKGVVPIATNAVHDVTDNDQPDQGVGLMKALGREVNKDTIEYLKYIKKQETLKFILGALAGQITFVIYVILDFMQGG